MTQLIIWRHAPSEWNVGGRFQGQADIDLTDQGEEEAVDAVPRIAGYRPDLIVSSDLRRAARTAAVLASVTGLAVEHDPRLRERHFGPWQGLTPAEVQQQFPAEHARWSAGMPLTDPAIETIDDLAKRVVAALREVAERADGGTAVVVTHGGAARVGCAGLLGWPSTAWHTLGFLANCHHAQLRYRTDRGWQLLRYDAA